MKNQNRVKNNRVTTGRAGQPAAPTKSFVRRKLKKLSPTARLLSDVAAEGQRTAKLHSANAVQLAKKIPPALNEALATADKLGLDFDFCARAVREGLKRFEQEDSLRFFVAEAIRHVRRMSAAKEDDTLFLYGFFQLLCDARHPARWAVGLASYKQGNDRELLFERIETGLYSITP